jgi:small subunit ribosomal protein S6
MRRYECVVILDPELNDDDLKSFTEKYNQLIANSGGEVIKFEDWGTKKLAYLVKKKDRGHYLLFDFAGTPALISELERQLKIADDVLKFLSIKLDDSIDLDAFKAKAEEAETVPETPAEPESASEDKQPAETAEVASAESTEQTVTEPQPEAEAQVPAEETKEGEVQ